MSIKSLSHYKLSLVFFFLKNWLRVEGIIVLFVFVSIADVDAACFASIGNSQPPRPNQIFNTHDSFWYCLWVFSDCFKHLLDSNPFDRPFLTIKNDIFEFWFRWVLFRLSFNPFLLLLCFKSLRFQECSSSVFEKRGILINPVLFRGESVNFRPLILLWSFNFIWLDINYQRASRNNSAGCLYPC